MSKLDAFLAWVRTHPKFAAAAAADPRQLRSLAGVEVFFTVLETRSDPRTIDLHDDVVRIVGAKQRPIKDRLIDLHATMQAALPWIKALADKMPGVKH